MPEKVSVTLPGTVEKIIKSPHPSVPEKAEIAIDGADELYREIRIENALTDKRGEEVCLAPGAKVDVTVEADPKSTAQSAGKS
jgi:hypothetical protein